MYSPKIKEDLVYILYRKAQLTGKTMTGMVDELLRPMLVVEPEEDTVYICHNCRVRVDVVGEDNTGYCDECESVVFVERS